MTEVINQIPLSKQIIDRNSKDIETITNEQKNNNNLDKSITFAKLQTVLLYRYIKFPKFLGNHFRT